MKLPYHDALVVALCEAKVVGEKRYVDCDGMVCESRPNEVFYECYPGGRILAWGLSETSGVPHNLLMDEGLTNEEVAYLGGEHTAGNPSKVENARQIAIDMRLWKHVLEVRGE